LATVTVTNLPNFIDGAPGDPAEGRTEQVLA
jgi:hypothetical protein